MLINQKSIVFAETMDHGRDEEQENLLENMIRDGDDVDITSQFLNDSSEGVEGEADGSGEEMEGEADGSGSRTLINTESGEVY